MTAKVIPFPAHRIVRRPVGPMLDLLLDLLGAEPKPGPQPQKPKTPKRR
jgi:hypothetical protein